MKRQGGFYPSLRLWALALTCLVSGVAAQANDKAVSLSWADLRPPAAEAHNPFANLSPEQTDTLGEIVLSHWLASRAFTPGDEGVRRREVLSARLAADGLNVESLLAQRQALMDQRRSNAETPVTGLDGQRVQLGGYLVPVSVSVSASASGQRVTDYLLVPWAGACSHTPPPPTNQIVRLRVAAPGLQLPQSLNTPVMVTGTLRIAPQEQSLFLADGQVSVRSAYAMDAAELAQ